MFDHVKYGVSDYRVSRDFYLKALAPIGAQSLQEFDDGIEIGIEGVNASLCLFQTDEKPAHLHIAFVAQTRRQVDEFHRAALDAGATDNGPPGLRRYHANYYAAFVIGPDGHNLEMVCHKAEP